MTHPAPRWFRARSVSVFGLGFALFALLSSDIRADGPTKINWRSDLAQAQAEARDQDRLLWIQFTGPWCINCKRMEVGAFAQPEIIAESAQRFVPVKLRSDEHEALALDLGLSSLPSTVIVRPSGEVVEKLEGYADSDEFRGFLYRILQAEGRYPGHEKPKDEKLALGGYCPVSLIQDRKLAVGRADVTAVHEGKIYRFVDAAHRDRFRQKPESFAPVNGEQSPVLQVESGKRAAGNPRFGVYYQGHLFLCTSQEERLQFFKNPERYANVDLADRGTCTHCIVREPILARQAPGLDSVAVARRYAPHAAGSAPVLTRAFDSGAAIRR